MAYQWTTKLPYQPDGLFDKLSSPNEGWCISDGENDVDVPLGKLDAIAYKILSRSIERNKRIAIALPRVKNGVSLSIIAYLVVNRFINQHGRSLKNLLPISLDNGQSIVIATQNRRLRDFFLLSSLKFSGTKFPFTYFPISRIRPTGDLASLVNKSESRGQITSNPIVFYHFDELDAYPETINNGFLLGELTETNSSGLALKLCKFMDQTKIDSGLILVNQYSENTLAVLRANNFQIISFTTEDILRSIALNDQTNLPSLNSSLTLFPKKVTLKLHLIEDKNIEDKLAKILQILLSLNKKFTDRKPRLLIKSWGIFYVLKDLCVPLQSIEQYRKGNPWLKTIKHNLQQIFQFPLNKLDEHERNILAPIWGTLESEFSELYNYLGSKNPKYDYIKSIIEKAKDSESFLVFPSLAQADVLKEELLIGGLVNEEKQGINVSFINDLVKNSKECKDIVLPGVWRKTEESKIFSLLPQTINLLCYSSELPAIPSLLNHLNRTNSSNWQETINSLQSIEYSIAPDEGINTETKWITPDTDSQFFIDYFKEFTPKSVEDHPNFDKQDNFDWLSGQTDDYEEDSDSEELEGSNVNQDNETVPSYKLLLENNRVIFIPTDQEVMAYSEDGEIQSKLAEALEPGDVILLYSHEQNREMFDSVIQRTQEISGVDPRILSLWKTALKSLKEKYDLKNPNSVRAYLNDLKDQNCQKTEQAVKMWLRGTTLAPRDQVDIESLLNLVEFKNVQPISKLIHREIEKTRIFHRILGRRLREKLGNLIRGENSQQVVYDEPVDREIDEILEMAEPIAIKEISKDIKYVQKNDVKVNVLG